MSLSVFPTMCRQRGALGIGVGARLALGADACAGVLAMHERHMAHFDLKPPNVLVFTEGVRQVAKLCDFRAARRFDPTTGLADTQGCLLCAPHLPAPRGFPCRVLQGLLRVAWR